MRTKIDVQSESFLTLLRQYCLAQDDKVYKLMSHRKFVETATFDRKYWFSRISTDKERLPLFVAHVDTVQQGKWFDYVTLPQGVIAYSGGLDDRIGCAVIHEVSKRVKCDILLTMDEERGMSTASMFVAKMKHVSPTVLVSYDRGGTDIVGYQYEHSKHWKDIAKELGFKGGFGSYSDICEMYDMGVLGFNLPCGYYSNHTTLSHARLWELQHSLDVTAALCLMAKNEPDRFRYKPTAQKALEWPPRGQYGHVWRGGERWFIEDDV